MPKKPQKNNKFSPASAKKEKEICKSLIDRIVRSRTFEPFDRPTIGCRFHRFRKRGEELAGVLGFPIQNFRQGTSYPLQLGSNEIVEIVGNKLLHKQIKEGELCGKRVKIVYLGRQFTSGGHHRKIYRIYKIDWPTIMSEQQWAELAKKARKVKK